MLKLIFYLPQKNKKLFQQIMRKTILMLGAILLITSTGCSNDKSVKEITLDDALLSLKIDSFIEDLYNIVEEQESLSYANPVSESEDSTLSMCATITRVPLFGTPLTVGQSVTKTIDFGASCSLDSGSIVSGKIIISYVYETNTGAQHLIDYSFDNFYHNGIKFSGDKTMKRIPITVLNPHPDIEMAMDLTATFPDGKVYRRFGDMKRETTQGFSTITLEDNVYSVTGTSSTFGSDISGFENVISPALTVKMSCLETNKLETVSGIITIDRDNGTAATIDYGRGTCDNRATITVNGNLHDVNLRN